MTPLILYGTGGHAAVLTDLLADSGRYEICEVIDDSPECQGRPAFGRIVRSPEFVRSVDLRSTSAIIGIGSNEDRARAASSLGDRDFPVLVHSTAVVGTDVQLGEGTVVMPRAVIERGANVGAHCIVNNGAVIGHGSIVGDFSHVSGNAVLAGGVRLGECCLIAMNACVLPNVEIGSDSVVGAGAVATRSVPSGYSVIQAGSRIIKRYEKQSTNQPDLLSSR